MLDYGEIDEGSLMPYIDRAFQLMELNLKKITTRGRDYNKAFTGS